MTTSTTHHLQYFSKLHYGINDLWWNLSWKVTKCFKITQVTLWESYHYLVMGFWHFGILNILSSSFRKRQKHEGHHNLPLCHSLSKQVIRPSCERCHSYCQRHKDTKSYRNPQVLISFPQLTIPTSYYWPYHISPQFSIIHQTQCENTQVLLNLVYFTITKHISFRYSDWTFTYLMKLLP